MGNLTLRRARGLRKALTPQELGLWQRLRGRKLGGFRFRRQHPVGPYILDFYCAEARLAVELDGHSHDAEGAAEHDARREAWLIALGVTTLRIANDAAKDPDAVAAQVPEVLRRMPPQSLRDSSPASGGARREVDTHNVR